MAIAKLAAPTVEYYRFLYNSVGRDFDWVDRDIMTDDRLTAIIHDRRVEIFELQVDGKSAGFAELDRRQPPDIEIAYFGLFPENTGIGLGRYFLSWTLQRAWSYQPKRVWVPTCDLDHPAALPNYLQAGFEIYDEKIIPQVVTDQGG